MANRIIKKRIKAIRSDLAKKRINCLIVTKPANVTYTTGFMGEDSWAVITKRGIYLLTDSRYTEQAQKECVGCKIIQRPDSLYLAQALAKLLKKIKTMQNVAVEKSLSLADFELLKKEYHGLLVRQAHHPERSRGAARDIKSVANLIETIRSCKDKSEVAAIKAAAQVAAKALRLTLPYIKPGVTENELAGMLNFQIRKLGATNSFETIVAFGPNASRPHHQPSKRKLKKNDTILIDFGVRYKGYCCDITRCFAVGLRRAPFGSEPQGRRQSSRRPTAFYKKVYDAVQKSQAAAIKMIKAGVEIAKVDAAAREMIRKSGFPVYGHGTGHGLGLEIHELPYIKAKSKGRLEAGHIITIEPAVYIPGKIGIRIEDDILVTKTGCEILTRNCLHWR